MVCLELDFIPRFYVNGPSYSHKSARGLSAGPSTKHTALLTSSQMSLNFSLISRLYGCSLDYWDMSELVSKIISENMSKTYQKT